MYDMIPVFHSFFKPFSDFGQMKKDFLVTHSVRGFSTDVRDNGDAYILEAELPGFDKKDISISIREDQLTIRAEHTVEDDQKDGNGNYLRRERYYGSYSRSYDVSQIDTDQIKASYENGILTLQLPKKNPDMPETKQIDIG